MNGSVTLQINMHPNDARHVGHLLPHQLRVWGKQVDRTLVILDLHRSRAGRYRNQAFDHNLKGIRRTLNEIGRSSNLDVVEVDYAPRVRLEVAESFFDAYDIPEKAWDGGPFYSYFFGLWAARTRYVFHMDSDMLYGGRSQSWIGEAISYLESDDEVVFVAPLSGPPRLDGRLVGQKGAMRKHVTRPSTFLFPTVSTRVYFTSASLLRGRMGRLAVTKPDFSRRLRARIMGNPPRMPEAETVLSQNMQRHLRWRADMLGAGPGVWSLHPPYRSELFYWKLPELIDRIENDDVPDEQRGHYDLNDSMIDWSVPRRENTKLRRWFRHLLRLNERMTERRPANAGNATN